MSGIDSGSNPPGLTWETKPPRAGIRRTTRPKEHPPLESQTRHCTQSSGHPAYRDRALPRPAEEPEDQGLGFDVQTRPGRRSALKASGTSAGEIPDGPDVLEQSGIVRSDIRSSFGD